MDALVKTAIESLVKKILPLLQQQLDSVLQKPQSRASAELIYLVQESRALLDLTAKWSQPQEQPQATPAPKNEMPHQTLNDDEAMMLLSEMDGEPESPPADQLDDVEADALLAEMEASSAVLAKPRLHLPKVPPRAPIGDDEASRLLAEMDGELDSGPLKPATQGSSHEDDEAARLLAEMAEMDEMPQPPLTTQSIPSLVKRSSSAVKPTESNQDAEDVKEIAEWEPNDFQSDPSMLNDFIVNSDELMQTVDDAILRLEQEPTNKQIIEEIFRAAHTLKGGSGMFGFKGIERVMHRMENLFDLVRKEKLIPNSDTIDTVFSGIDLLRRLLQAVKDGKPCGIETANVVRALSLAAQGKAIPKSAISSLPSASTSAPESITKTTPPIHDDDEHKKDNAKATKKTEQSTIRVDLERLDVLVNLIGELVIDRITRKAMVFEK